VGLVLDGQVYAEILAAAERKNRRQANVWGAKCVKIIEVGGVGSALEFV
jgi:hypothetical protein